MRDWKWDEINWPLLSQLAVLMLMVDAGVVFAGLLQQKNMWILIVVYWFILTLKNLFDFVGSQVHKPKM